jgi:hypothetical protein
MYTAELIEFCVLTLLGIICLLRYRKTRQLPLLLIALVLIAGELCRGGLAWKHMQQKEQEAQGPDLNTIKPGRPAVMNEMASKRVLPQDSLVHFDGTVELLIPAGFSVAEYVKGEMKNLLITKAFEPGAFIVSVSKLNNRDHLSFSAYTHQLDQMHMHSQVHYETSPNTTLLCTDSTSRVLNYKAYQNKQLASAGVMYNASKGKFLYSIIFSNYTIDPAATAASMEKIYRSLKITE